MVESDSKICVDTLLQESFGCNWNISAICNNVKCLALDLSCILALFNDILSFSKKAVHVLVLRMNTDMVLPECG
jgi:hypothetical protein